MCKSAFMSLLLSMAVMTALSGCAMSNRDDDDDVEDEVPVQMEQLPVAAKATLMKEAGAGKIEEVEQMTRNGRRVYEADVMMDGKKWEIMVRDDGQLIKKELDEETDDEDDRHEKSEGR